MKIGLTYTGTMQKHQNYVNWTKFESWIEIVKLSAEENNIQELSSCDALVLCGGLDIHPKFYGKSKVDYKFRPEHFEEQRDQFEINAFKLSQELRIPVLGICRGLQLVNCVLGGTLKQDLGNLNLIHKAEKNETVQYDKAHGIKIESNSLLYEISDGGERAVVNSAHHQSIKKLGKALKVNCWADDGTIEGIEWIDKKGKPFLLCIQWHPERMIKFQLEDSVMSKSIRARFIKEIQQSKENKK
jgi:putative glutamine amidotransferase